jgi:hypothetical protein
MMIIMSNFRWWLRCRWSYVEVYFWKMLLFFGIEQSSKPIPKGYYCYVPDIEKNKTVNDGSYYIKPCKYYRSVEGELNAGCTYVGYIGFDPSLGDQCKICETNKR